MLLWEEGQAEDKHWLWGEVVSGEETDQVRAPVCRRIKTAQHPTITCQNKLKKKKKKGADGSATWSDWAF